MKKIQLAFALLLTSATAAWATPGTPDFMMITPTQEFPFNASTMDEIDLAAFKPADGFNCAQHFADIRMDYTGTSVGSRIGAYTYFLVREGWASGDSNRLSFESAQACEARDIGKLKRMSLAFQGNEMFIFQYTFIWYPTTKHVELKQWMLGDTTSYGAVITTH